MFDINKPVQTKNGRSARIICKDRRDDKYPIIALVGDNDTIITYTVDGYQYGKGQDCSYDLINIPEKGIINVLIEKLSQTD